MAATLLPQAYTYAVQVLIPLPWREGSGGGYPVQVLDNLVTPTPTLPIKGEGVKTRTVKGNPGTESERPLTPGSGKP